MKSPDVIIAGAGIIGLSIALELQQRGAQVLVLDRGEPGSEASSAAAGMLAASDPETPFPLRELALASAKLFPQYVARLEELSEVVTDFRRRGAIVLPGSSELPAGHRRLTHDDLQRMEPALAADDRPAYFVPEDCVDPVLLVKAASTAASRLGIEIRAHCEVREIKVHQTRPRGSRLEITTDEGVFTMATVVDCRGAWSGVPVRPRKGQSFYMRPERTGMIEHVVRAHDVYMVPRSSGKILVGATVEDVGFDKTVEPEIIASLHCAAAALVPDLATARIVRSWAGLRPGTPDDLPLLGQTETPGCFIATGHFRNGILLAPATAQIVANLVNGKPAGFDLSAFAPDRFVSRPLATNAIR